MLKEKKKKKARRTCVGNFVAQVDGKGNKYKLETYSLTIIAVESPSLNAQSISMMVHVFG
jgi:hypothetical protein